MSSAYGQYILSQYHTMYIETSHPAMDDDNSVFPQTKCYQEFQRNNLCWPVTFSIHTNSKETH